MSPQAAVAAPVRPKLVTHTRTTARPALPDIGSVIAGKYRIERLLGEGGMGAVYEAYHMRLAQRLAIKVLHPNVAHYEEVVLRFEREARAAARLQSINCARVIDVDALPNGLPYIVMEYLEGRDLFAELEIHRALPIADAVDYVMQAATAMTEAHSLGIIHRDLKPSNLFLCPAGASARKLVKVLDFGVSKLTDEGAPRITKDSGAVGTPDYMSPEQVRAMPSLDTRADIWSLGVILFEALTGRPPYVGPQTAVVAQIVADPVPSPASFRNDLPTPLVRAVMRMLEKDPRRRVQTMAEVVELLAPFGPRERIATIMAEAPRPGGRLGEILVADGLLSAQDLDRALVEQRNTGRLLGAVLTDMGLVSRADLLTALAKQQGIAEPSAGPHTVRVGPAKRRPLAVVAGVFASIAIVVAGAFATTSALAHHMDVKYTPAQAMVEGAPQTAASPTPAKDVHLVLAKEIDDGPAEAPAPKPQPAVVSRAPAPVHAPVKPAPSPRFDPTHI
jgi:serine/threonine-protein kinase